MKKRKGIMYHTVKVELLRRGMTIGALAAKLGITRQAVMQKMLEPTSTAQVADLAKALDLEPSELIERCWQEHGQISMCGRTIEPLTAVGEHIVYNSGNRA